MGVELMRHEKWESTVQVALREVLSVLVMCRRWRELIERGEDGRGIDGSPARRRVGYPALARRSAVHPRGLMVIVRVIHAHAEDRSTLSHVFQNSFLSRVDAGLRVI